MLESLSARFPRPHPLVVVRLRLRRPRRRPHLPRDARAVFPAGTRSELCELYNRNVKATVVALELLRFHPGPHLSDEEITRCARSLKWETTSEETITAVRAILSTLRTDPDLFLRH